MTGDVHSYPISEDEMYGGKWHAEFALSTKGIFPSPDNWSGGLSALDDGTNLGGGAQPITPDPANAHDEDVDASAAVSAETAVLLNRTDLSADLAWMRTWGRGR